MKGLSQKNESEGRSENQGICGKGEGNDGKFGMSGELEKSVGWGM